MKSTFDLPDDLMIAAKKVAAGRRVPLRDLVARGLRAELRVEHPSKRRAQKVRWVTVNGGLPSDLDVTSREKMHEWLRRKR